MAGENPILHAVASPWELPPATEPVLRRSLQQLEDVFRSLDWVAAEAAALKNRLATEFSDTSTKSENSRAEEGGADEP